MFKFHELIDNRDNKKLATIRREQMDPQDHLGLFFNAKVYSRREGAKRYLN